MSKYTGNLYRSTSLRNGGRKAGDGIDSDDYSEDAGWDGVRYGTVRVRLPNDGTKPEELNGPVKVYAPGEEPPPKVKKKRRERVTDLWQNRTLSSQSSRLRPMQRLG